MHAQDDDWMFPNRIKKAKIMKPGSIWHEHLFARHIPTDRGQARPAAYHLAPPKALWGAAQMVAAKVDSKAAQQRLGHSRPTTLLIHYTGS